MNRVPLPIDPILPELVQSLERTPNLVLKAAPGSGKTTRVPPALLNAGFAIGERRDILVLEPRRLAAKYSAHRVAQELGEPIGQTVGYQFRFESVGGTSTRLRYLTEGMLLRKLQGDPKLRHVASVFIDEFHERHLMTDAAMAVLRWLQATSRPDLRIVVMSATLDTGPVSEFLANAPVFEVANRPYPVEIRHLPSPPQKPLELLVRDAALGALSRQDVEGGDILVFLPGMAEIRRAEQAISLSLEGQGKNAPLVLPLHGELSREEQDRAIKPGDRRKVILSTNVAETSLTIDGVTTVIDGGLHRQATYSWWSGLPALRTRAISRASAIQRAGRAGRTAPGYCYRLYTQGEFEARAAFETPEIQRADLAQTLLELKALGVPIGAGDFRWFEPPSPSALESCWKLLRWLGAIDTPSPSAALTPLGQALASLPVHPRIGRVLIEAQRLGVLDEATHLCALISEGQLERLDALDNLSIPLHSESLRRSRSQLVQAARSVPSTVTASKAPVGLGTREERIRFSLLTGFPDRVARLRKAPASASRGRVNEVDLVFCAGGSAQVAEEGIEEGSLLLALEAQEEQRLSRAGATRVNQIRVRCLSPIREEWLIDLEPTMLSEQDDFAWDDARERVMLSSRMTYGDLVLSEASRPAEPGLPAARTLARGALGVDLERLVSVDPSLWTRWIEALARISDRDGIESAFARTALLTRHFPAEASGDAEAAAHLRDLVLECVSARELRDRDWISGILSARVPGLLGRADQLLPCSIALPSGRRAPIHYPSDKGPWVESRLQDFFGMNRAPSLLDGKVPLTIHLLAPNHRAVQVTTDLAGFWEREYPELRRSLSRRYPRHSWPEDPLKPDFSR